MSTYTPTPLPNVESIEDATVKDAIKAIRENIRRIFELLEAL